MKSILFVFIGGGIGSLFRYWIGLFLSSNSTIFPWKTFAANIIGCFLLGCITALLPQQVNGETKLLLTTGLCGGFTTFSTFSSEAVQMLQTGQYGFFLAYVIGSLAFGFLAIYAGMKIGSILG